MGIFRGPNIVTDGLVLSLDAGSTRSYPGGGSSWKNLTGLTPDLTILGSPSHEILSGATCFNLDSDGDHFSASNITTLTNSTQRTLEAWIHPASSELTSGDRGTVILMQGGSGNYMSWNKGNTRLSNYWYNKSPAGYHESGPANTRGQWHHWCSVWTGSELKQWVDGVKYTVTPVTGTSTQNTGINIGRESGGRQFSGGIAVIRVYNNLLSDDQVLQNYNAQKKRFGH